MEEEEAEKEESKSEEKKDLDLTQIQEQVTQIIPVVKPLAANALEWINAIPIAGGVLGAAAGFWLHQSIIRALSYFILTFFIFDLLLPLRNSVRKRLQPHIEALGSWLVDGGIARFKREAREIYWRYARKNQKFLLVQGLECQSDDIDGLSRDLAPLLKDMFVPLELASTTKEQKLSLSRQTKAYQNPADNYQGLQIWHLLKLAKDDPTYRRILIKAKGGLGKTTLLRHITYTYSQKHLQRGIPRLLPVLIRLRDWDHRLIVDGQSPDSKDLPIPDLAELIQNYIKTNPNLNKLNFPENWAKNSLEKGKLLILWDGFDEISRDWQNSVSHWLGKQMHDYPASYFILTSRPYWYDKAYTANEKPKATLYIQEFNLDQIERFIHNWYLSHLKHENKIQGYVKPKDYLHNIALEKTANLLKQLEERSELMKLAEIPLNLNMIVNLHRSSQSDHLPRRRAELYQEILELQLIKRPKVRNINMILRESDRQKVLQNLALSMGTKGEKQIDEKELKSHVIEFIQNLGYLKETDTFIFLENVVSVSEILVNKDKFYEFSHLSFQSYLMAMEINDQAQENLLIDNWNKSDWWRDAVKLYSALQRNASTFLRRLVALNNFDATSLAKECLLEIPQDRLEPELLAELKAVEKTVQNSLYQQLENYLKNGQWREADQETARLMLQITGKELDQGLDIEDIQNFPSEDLQTIDNLWFLYSNGKFGFSIQRNIWLNCIGISNRNPPEYLTYSQYFSKYVGWRDDNDWFTLVSQYNFDLLSSKKGHLPLLPPNNYGWNGFAFAASLFSRFDLVSHDFQQLQIYLKNGQWRKADEETARLLLKIVGKEADQVLYEDEIITLSCDKLLTIDQLWKEYSKGHFGFSIQLQIMSRYDELPERYDWDNYVIFAEELGWHQKDGTKRGKWLNYDEISFNLDSPMGHLPLAKSVFLEGYAAGRWHLFSRIKNCNL